MKNKLASLLLTKYFWIYILLAFPIIDYTLRNVLKIPVVSSLWDEGVLFILLLFTLFKIMDQDTNPLPSVKKPLLAFFILGVAFLVIDMPYFAANLEGFRATFQYILVFFIGFYLMDSKERFIYLLRFIVSIGTVIGLYGVFQFIIGVETPAHWVDSGENIRTRVFSIVQSPNVLGSHMAFIIPIAVALAIVEKKWFYKIIWIGAIFILFACLIFTYSRGAWLALIGAFAIISILIDKRLLILGGIAAIAGVIFMPEILDRILYLFSSEYWEKSASGGRIQRWLGAYDQMLYEPFFGAGMGHYGGAVGARHFGTTYVDSYYFKTIAEFGLIGIMLYGWLLLSIFKNGLLTWKKAISKADKIIIPGVFTALIAIMLHNAVENIFEVPYLNTYFWFLTGALFSYPFLTRKEEEKDTAGRREL